MSENPTPRPIDDRSGSFEAREPTNMLKQYGLIVAVIFGGLGGTGGIVGALRTPGAEMTAKLVEMTVKLEDMSKSVTDMKQTLTRIDDHQQEEAKARAALELRMSSIEDRVRTLEVRAGPHP